MPWGPLANYGLPNPAFYHTDFDDFDYSLSVTGPWTKQVNANGTIAQQAGDGGSILFTTNSSTPLTTDIAVIQRPFANFNFTLGKKFFFLARVQLADVINPALLMGLVQTTATPFTVTDGLYFLKASGSSTNLILRSTNTSVNTDIAIPTAEYLLTNATYVDMSFSIDRNGVVYGSVGQQLLVGYIPQSGVGAVSPDRCPDVSFSPTLTAANLNVTLGIQSGTASSKTAAIDFVLCAKER
jgi:hypothetical protein